MIASASRAGDAKMQGTPFVTKTFLLVSDASNDDTVCWSELGDSFVVKKPVEFSSEVLPKFFKHNNFCSFIRQLNTYGFVKIESKLWEFQHEHFKKNQPQLLKSISRRKSKKRDQDRDNLDPDNEEIESVIRLQHGIDVNTLGQPKSDGPTSMPIQQDWSILLSDCDNTPLAPSVSTPSADTLADPLDDVIFRSQTGDNKRQYKQDLSTYGTMTEPDLGFATVVLSPPSSMSPLHTPSSAAEYDRTPNQGISNSEAIIHSLHNEVKKLSEKQSQTQDTIVKILHEMMESRREQSHLEKKVAHLNAELTRLQMSNSAQRSEPQRGDFLSNMDYARMLNGSPFNGHDM